MPTLEIQDSPVFKKVCNDRVSPVEGTTDVTQLVHSLLPFDTKYETSYTGRNFLGGAIKSYPIQSRRIYTAINGKRLVIEVGCSTVIYLQISPDKPDLHHRIFIQSHRQFLHETVTGVIGKIVSENASPMKTIVKYEMYFLMGFFSTVSVAMWLAVTGSNALYVYADSKNKIEAYKKLAIDLSYELSNIKKYAPTLYSALLDFITNEKNINLRNTVRQLPRTIVTDEAVQGQVVGILFGKYINSAKAFTIWSALSTVLIQAAVKSATKSVDALSEVATQRYMPIISELQKVNWSDPKEREVAAAKLVRFMSGVDLKIDKKLALKIIEEVVTHPVEAKKSLENVKEAFNTFNKAVQ